MASIPTIKQQVIDFNPATFTAGEYNYKPLDASILSSALAQRRDMEEKANDEMSALDNLFAELKPKVANDDETNKWFVNFENKYKNAVQGLAASGDYGAARNLAKRMASQAAADKSLQGRMKWKTDYDTREKEVEDGFKNDTYDKDTVDWWKATKQNTQTYKDSVDENGNVIGSNNYDVPLPYKKVDTVGIINAAFRMITPDKNSTSRGWSTDGMVYTIDALGNKIYKTDENDDNIRQSSGGKSVNTYERVSKTSIIENVRQYIEGDSTTNNALRQNFDVALWKYGELDKQYKQLSETDKNNIQGRALKSQLDQYEKMLFNNGSADYNSYLTYHIENSDIIKNMAYEWKTTSTDTESSTIPVGSGRGRSKSKSDNDNTQMYSQTGNEVVDGAMVEKTNNTLQKTDASANSSASTINNIFTNVTKKTK